MRTETANEPTLIIEADMRQAGRAVVAVRNLDPDLLDALGRGGQTSRLLESIFRVRVVGAEMPGGEKLPDIFGRRQVWEDGIRFIPHFPFEAGVLYRAIFDPRPLGGPDLLEVLTLEFSLPRESNTSPTKVEQVFPSSDSLPENLLRFYVCFSNSMQRGRAEAEIKLLGPDGQPAPDTLYRAPVELWSRSMKCLTVLLDPGRLKRGVGPNRELGPPLKAGREYTLEVGRGMTDLSGRSLRKSFYKRFHVTQAVREHIAVEEWKLAPPATKSRQPLMLFFPRSLDWALLRHAIAVTANDARSVDGEIEIDESESRWSFTPASPWAAGSYRVGVASSLEDVCGNSVVAAFDRPIRPGNDLRYESATRSIDFHLV